MSLPALQLRAWADSNVWIDGCLQFTLCCCCSLSGWFVDDLYFSDLGAMCWNFGLLGDPLLPRNWNFQQSKNPKLQQSKKTRTLRFQRSKHSQAQQIQIPNLGKVLKSQNPGLALTLFLSPSPAPPATPSPFSPGPPILGERYRLDPLHIQS